MKAISFLILPVAAALAVSASAQHPMGFTAGWDLPGGGILDDATSGAHGPPENGMTEGDLVTRIDSDDYGRWGLDPVVDPSYGTVSLAGVEFVLEDLDFTTPEPLASVVAWTEDLANPNFPDVAGFDPQTGGSNFMRAIVPESQFAATIWTFTFPTPPTAATDQDLFFGVNIGAGVNPLGFDGFVTDTVVDQFATIPPPANFDNPGPGASAIAQGSYVSIIPTQNQFPTGTAASYYPYLAQNRFEVYLQSASGGVATAVTNQASYSTSGSAVGVGTPNFLSGLHPDASAAPVNSGRNSSPPQGWTGDQLGYIFTDSRLSANDLVFVVVSVGENPAPFPLTAIPGTGAAPTGLVLVDPITHVGVGLGMASAVADPNFAYTRFSMPPLNLPMVTRVLLETIHPTLVWQAFGLSQGNIHATGLAKQHF